MMYKYQLTIRHVNSNTVPFQEGMKILHNENIAQFKFGQVEYPVKLSMKEVLNFSLIPLSCAEELDEKTFKIPFGFHFKETRFSLCRIDYSFTVDHLYENGQKLTQKLSAIDCIEIASKGQLLEE